MSLPDADVVRLAERCRAGADALRQLRSAASTAAVRSACEAVLSAAAETPLAELAGVLEGARRLRRASPPQPEVVWTGPALGPGTHRLTAAVVADLVDQAERSVLLVSYAMYSEHRVREALQRATTERDIDVTLLAERPADNPHFDGPGHPFPGVAATRLSWRSASREPGASLHAKVMVIDDHLALVGSANVTQSAMERNLECGLLVRDPRVALALAGHIRALRAGGYLIVVG